MHQQRRTMVWATWGQSVTLALLLTACGGGSGTSLTDFPISEGTLEVTTIVDGLNFPTGLAIDIDATTFKDQIFVAEKGASRVIAVDTDGMISEITASSLSAPNDLLFDILPDALFTVESQSNEISRIDFSQTPAVVTVVAALPQGVFPQTMTSDGEFRYVGARNTTKLNLDQIYNINTNSPKLLAEGFQNISAIAYRLNDEQPELLVSDSKAGAIYALDLEAADQETQTEFTTLVEELQNPGGIAVGPASGFIYVCETGANQLIRLTADGKDREVVAKIIGPFNLLFDESGNLYVTGEEGKLFKISGLKEKLN